MPQVAFPPSIPVLKYVPTDSAIANEEIIDEEYIKSYSDRTNIDWSYEYSKESAEAETKHNGVTEPVYKRVLQSNSKLLVLIFTGLIIGPVAIAIDVFSRFLNDFRYGVCLKEHSYLATKVQCGEDDWRNWSDLIFKMGDNKESVFAYLNNYVYFVLLSVLAAYLTTFFVKAQPFVKYSGISELKIILSGYILHQFLSFKILAAKSLGLIFVIGSGIWVGKEGPLVHVAACISHEIIRFFPRIRNNEALKREMITASTAAGIGVAFNAPIGGVLFCLEQIRTYFPIDRLMWNSFVCATISVMILQTLHPFSDLIYVQIFQVTNTSQNWLRYEIIPFMFLGVVGGYLGLLFNRLNYKFAEVRKVLINNSVRSKILEVVALSLITAIISYPFAITRLPLTELTSLLFSDCKDEEANALASSICDANDKFPWKILAVLSVTSIQAFLLAAYSYGTFIPGGVLMPAITIGALVGRFLGTFVEYVQFKFPNSTLFESCSLNSFNCITPGSYAVVGAASFLTSVTKMSVSVVVILFELTGALNYVIPIMIGVMLSRFIADLYSDKSCYELWLELQDYPYLRPGLDEELNKPLLSVFTCGSFLKPFNELVVIYDDELSVTALTTLVKSVSFKSFPVLNNRQDNHLLGMCSRHELALMLTRFENYDGPLSFQSNGVLQKILSNTDYYIISADMPVLTLYALFDKLSLKAAVFCYPDQKCILRSLMTKKDLIEIIELDDKSLLSMQNNNEISAVEEENELLNRFNGAGLEEFIIDDEADEEAVTK